MYIYTHVYMHVYKYIYHIHNLYVFNEEEDSRVVGRDKEWGGKCFPCGIPPKVCHDSKDPAEKARHVPDSRQLSIKTYRVGPAPGTG